MFKELIALGTKPFLSVGSGFMPCDVYQWATGGKGGGWGEKGGGALAVFKTATTNSLQSLVERADRRREWHIA